jgi:hypothetical protein
VANTHCRFVEETLPLWGRRSFRLIAEFCMTVLVLLFGSILKRSVC